MFSGRRVRERDRLTALGSVPEKVVWGGGAETQVRVPGRETKG